MSYSDQREALKSKKERLAELFHVLRPTEPEPNGHLLEFCYHIEALPEAVKLTGGEWAEKFYQAYKKSIPPDRLDYKYYQARLRFIQRLPQTAQVMFSLADTQADFTQRVTELLIQEFIGLVLSITKDALQQGYHLEYPNRGYSQPFTAYGLGVKEPTFFYSDGTLPFHWRGEKPEVIKLIESRPDDRKTLKSPDESYFKSFWKIPEDKEGDDNKQ